MVASMKTSYLALASCGLLALTIGCGDDETSTPMDTEGASSSSGDGDDSTTGEGSTGTTDGDGSTTMEPTTTADGDGSSTGATVECGNGEVEEGEECDDSDLENDDACRSDCTIPYEIGWTAVENGDASGADEFVDVEVLDDGSLLVLGTVETAETGLDVWLKSYAADGTPGSLDFTYDGEGLDDVANSMVRTADGVIITLTSEAETTAEDIMTISVSLPADADPTVAWEDRYDGPGVEQGGENDLVDIARGVTVDADGNVYVIGHQRGETTFFDIIVRKLDAQGEPVWSQDYDGPGSRSDFADDILIGPDGNVWALATETLEDQSTQAWLRRYDVDGNEVDTQNFGFSPNAMAFDADDNLIIAGFDTSNGTGPDFAVYKYDAEFTELWSYIDNGPAGGSDLAVDVAVDMDGAVYATGTLARLGEQGNIRTIKLDADGAPQWGAEYDQPETSLDDIGLGIAVNADGRVYVTGRVTVLGEDGNAWLTQYVQL